MAREHLSERGVVVGDAVRSRFHQMATRFPVIGDVRGLGAMMALELVKDRTTKEPDKERTARVQAEALKRGLLLLTAGTYGNVVRVLVPLTIDDAALAEGLAVLEQAFEATQ